MPFPRIPIYSLDFLLKGLRAAMASRDHVHEDEQPECEDSPTATES